MATQTPSLFTDPEGTAVPVPLGPDPSRPRAVATALPEQADAEALLASKGHRPNTGGTPLGFGQDSKVLDSLEDKEDRRDYTESLYAKVGRKTGGTVFNPTLGKRGVPTLTTATMINELSKLRSGKKVEWRKYSDHNRRELLVAHFLVDAIDAATYQMTKGDEHSGIEWYDRDVDALERGVAHIINHHPDFAAVAGTFGRPDRNGYITSDPRNPLQNPRMVLFKALLACTSPMRNPKLNTQVAFDILRHAVKNNPHSPYGFLPLRNPEPSAHTINSASKGGWEVGHGWSGVNDPGPSLAMINRLVNDKGENGAAEWLLTPQTRDEIEKYKPKLSPGDLTQGSNVPHPGAYIFGPKAGPFFLNNNKDGGHVTKDIWFSRTWNRIMGSLVAKGNKGPEIQDVPRGPEERSVMTLAVNRAATALNLRPHELQAVLWYYEQQLWSKLGTESPSYSYADGVRAVASKAGLSGLPSTKIRSDKDAKRRQAATAAARARRYSRRGTPRRYGRQTTAHPTVLAHVQSYLRGLNRPYEPIADYAAIDPQRSKAIADAYHALSHDPNHPAIRSSYDALKHETALQYQHLLNQGVKLEPWRSDGQPYANSAEMCNDARSGHLWFYTGGEMPSDHPLAAKSLHKAPDGEHLTYNDLFRAVHDYFGHALYGNEFGPRGEEHAWRSHVRMYSDAARPAMTMETRGQNSWVNYGKHLRDQDGNVPDKGQPGHVPATHRPYAEQKANALPEEHSKPYRRSGSPRRYMHDDSDFKKALAADPLNWDTHGIYADWLEDQGHEDAEWHRWVHQTRPAPLHERRDDEQEAADHGADIHTYVRGRLGSVTDPSNPSYIIDPDLFDHMASRYGYTHPNRARQMRFLTPRIALNALKRGFEDHKAAKAERTQLGKATSDSTAFGPDDPNHAHHLQRRGTKLRYSHEAFKAQIDADPLNWDHHGIYADYLEEQGHPDAEWHRWLWTTKPHVYQVSGLDVGGSRYGVPRHPDDEYHRWEPRLGTDEIAVLSRMVGNHTRRSDDYVYPHVLLEHMKRGWQAHQRDKDNASSLRKAATDLGVRPLQESRRSVGRQIRRYARDYLTKLQASRA